jgi:hypothetical protein
VSVILSSADGISFAVNEEWIGMNAMDVEFEIKWDRKRYNAIEKERIAVRIGPIEWHNNLIALFIEASVRLRLIFSGTQNHSL